MSAVSRSRGLRKLGRTILQWAVSMGSTGLTALVSEALGVEFGPTAAVAFQAFWLFFYTYFQNNLETAGKIPVLFPAPGLISSSLAPADGGSPDLTPAIAPTAAATVDAVADPAGQVLGEVTDLTGDVVGTVTGQLPPEVIEPGHD